MKKVKVYFTAVLLFNLLTLNSFCCDNSSISINNQTLNPDGSITYNLNFMIELGTLDVPFYGFTLSFLSSSNTPQVVLSGTYNTTNNLSTADLSLGSLTGTLQALTGSNINSVVQDSDWSVYQNMNNVLSFESSELFGAASNDFSATIDVTVMGCVEQIVFDASVNSGSSLCEFTINLNNNPYIEVSDDTNLCGGDSTLLTIDTAYGGILVDQFTMTFNNAFSHTTTGTTLPGVYYLIVSGTYYGSTNETRDACFGNGWYNGYVWTPGIAWKWNNVNPQNYAQIPTQLNTTNHTYQLIFSGGSSYTFSFTDTFYGDNGGALNFSLFYLGNISWSNGVTTYQNNVTPSNTTSYTATIDNGGCTNSDNVLVTINSGGSSVDVITNCNSYTWIDGINYTTSNNSASVVLPTSGGCDSLVQLDLTINYDSYGTDVQTTCGPFTWIDGVTYSSSTNTPTFTIANQSGCDSVITLDLTVGNVSNTVDQQIACDSLVWINGQTYTSSNNTAQFSTLNAQGCDSTINLDLTVHPSYFNALYDTICSSELPFNWNGFIYNTSGNQIEILSTTFNCDSVTEYFLTVNDTPTVSINIGDTTICMDSSIFIYASGADNFSWDGNITNNDYNIILDNGTYTVIGTDTNNCQSSSSVNITIDTCFIEPFSLNIPNVFTPNNDGENDGFFVTGTSFELHSTTIFNRWGEVVFQTNYNSPWDGRLSSGQKAPEGTYYFLIDFTKNDSGTISREIRKDYLSLFR